jgi:serine/threonine protein kinase
MTDSETVDVRMHGNRVLHIPRRIGRYEYIKVLGGGGSSVVVLIRRAVSGELFACKVVPRQLLIDEEIFGKFEQEVRLLPSLTHPNIVHFEEIVFGPELIYVIMEYCSQGDLFSHIVNSGCLGEGRSREIFQQIGDAVAYIHDKDIAHRDLKPDNVLLDRLMNAKLADFGLCHVTSSRRLLNTPCGSPLYAAPEVISAIKYEGKMADIWSLGILLYCMVTATLPWSSDNQLELFRQIREADVEIPTHLSASLQDLLTSMLQRNPLSRPTIKQVLSAPWLPRVKSMGRPVKPSSSAIADRSFDDLPPLSDQSSRRPIVHRKRKAAASGLFAQISSGEGIRSNESLLIRVRIPPLRKPLK